MPVLTTRSIASRLSILFLLLDASGASAQGTTPFADPLCPEYDSFVQEYEYTDEVMGMRDAAICAGSNTGGTPAFPVRLVRLRIEYRRGDHYVHQETREWNIEPGPNQCMFVTPRVVHAYRKRVGNREEAALLAPDKVRRSASGERVPNTLHFGTAHSRTPRVPTIPLRETAFGVSCQFGSVASGSSCMVILPKKCKSELYMAPIELDGNISVLPMRGRTTSLEIGRDVGVNPADWRIP
jgi:hypothetical protein